jgi:hypothetical protein
MPNNYLKDRKIFSEKFGKRDLFEVIDQWPLYCGVQNLARVLYIYDIFREIENVPGDLAEFGSWKGSNVILLAKLLSIYSKINIKRVHCFESFEGLNTFHSKDGDQSGLEGKYQGDYKTLLDIIDLYDLNNKIMIHKGLIQDTVPQFIKAEPSTMFSFLYFDADLYEPATIMLDNFAHKLSVGGVILFDEWNFPEWPGETKAVEEFLSNHNNFQQIQPSTTRQPSLLLKKLTN